LLGANIDEIRRVLVESIDRKRLNPKLTSSLSPSSILGDVVAACGCVGGDCSCVAQNCQCVSADCGCVSNNALVDPGSFVSNPAVMVDPAALAAEIVRLAGLHEQRSG
jgi:hypothetical protein